MKNKINNTGFSLVELLAVIVILAIILVIAVPQITKVINNAQKDSCRENFLLLLKNIEDKKALKPELDISTINKDNAKDILQVRDQDYKFIEFYIMDDKIKATVIYKDKCKGYITFGDASKVNIEKEKDYLADIAIEDEGGIYYNDNQETVDEPNECIAVTNATEFNNMRNDLNASYCLQNDIDLSSLTNWVPIGDESNRFKGQLIGNNHYIHGLNATATGTNSMAIFGVVEDAKFYNIRFKNINLSSSKNTALLVNMIYGSTSEIKNCKAESSNKIAAGENDSYSFAATFVSLLYGSLSLENSYSDVTFISGYGIGGFVGDGYSYPKGNLTIKDSQSIIKINKNTPSKIGGFVSSLSGFHLGIENSNVIADINIKTPHPTYTLSSAGFITDVNNSSISIDNSWFSGNISAVNSNVAGFIGVIGTTSDSSITNSYVKNSSLSSTCTNGGTFCKTGGFVSDLVYGNYKFDIENSYTRNTEISGATASSVIGFIGAFVPSIKNFKVINSNIATTSTAGHIIGYLSSSNNTLISNITINNSSITSAESEIDSSIGSILGRSTSGSLLIEDSTINSNVINQEKNQYAGLVVGSSGAKLEIKNVTATGKVIGNQSGGVIGYFSGSLGATINNVEVKSDIVGLTNGAGAIGAAVALTNIDGFKFKGSVEVLANDNNTSAGIVGAAFGNVSILNSSVDANIKGDGYTGGMLGNVTIPSTFGNITIKGSINAKDVVGGIIGIIQSPITITGEINSSISITAVSNVGGYAGIKPLSLPITGENFFKFTGSINATGSNVSNTYGLSY